MPVVRLTERKSELTSFEPTLWSAKRRDQSAIRKNAMPTTSSAAIPVITSLVSSVQRRRGCLRLNTVKNESEPRKAEMPITTIGQASCACPTKLRLPPIRSKPALLKAEMA